MENSIETAAEIQSLAAGLKEESCDILIIGAGTAGLSAAIYALRAGCSVLVLEANVHGGQIINTTSVENYPAIKEISGFEFAQGLYEQAKGFGARVLRQQIKRVFLAGPEKTVITNKACIRAKALIVATGAVHRHLGCQGEEQLGGRGVSYCATCDGALYRGKTVMVVGGGNTALMDALFLAKLCQKVYLVHRRDQFRGENIMVDAVRAAENIEILYDSVVEAFFGEQTLTAARVLNKKSGESRELAIDGAFIAVGNVPANDFLQGQVELDAEGYVLAGEDCRTSVAGVWAAGDNRQKPLRQLVTAAADGAVAGTAAAELVIKG